MSRDPTRAFAAEVAKNIQGLAHDRDLRDLSLHWLRQTLPHRYSYNFTWLGRPIIQYPQDMVALQELLWHIRPDLVIETGVAHGGSLVLSASLLALLDLSEAAERGELLDPARPRRRVVGIDIEIRSHNRAAIAAHPLAARIDLIEGSAVAPTVVAEVAARARGLGSVLVCLDSNHSHAHVLAELEAYAPLVTPGSYCVVFDTVIADLPKEAFPNRPWGPGDNPRTAVAAFLAGHPEFEVDAALEAKLLITVAPGGFLRRRV